MRVRLVMSHQNANRVSFAAVSLPPCLATHRADDRRYTTGFWHEMCVYGVLYRSTSADLLVLGDFYLSRGARYSASSYRSRRSCCAPRFACSVSVFWPFFLHRRLFLSFCLLTVSNKTKYFEQSEKIKKIPWEVWKNFNWFKQSKKIKNFFSNKIECFKLNKMFQIFWKDYKLLCKVLYKIECFKQKNVSNNLNFLCKISNKIEAKTLLIS